MTLPDEIYAITIAKTGGSDVVEKTQIPFPKSQSDHIVVKAEHLGVNFIDTYFRKGLYPSPRLPQVLGVEAAGVVVSLPTDEGVLNDPDYRKRGHAVGARVVVETLGVHAEYISVPWNVVFPVPETVSTRTAAAVFSQGVTVISFMEEAYDVQKDDVILIHTVAGGLGLLLCQFAKYRGATVIGTTSTEEKADIAKQNGADYVIIYKKENTVERVLEITNGEGVHAVFDGVGKDTFEANFKLLRRKGTFVSVGNASGAVPSFSPLKLSEKNLKFLRPAVQNYKFTAREGFYYSSKLWDLVASGTLRQIIYKEYPFTAEGAREAQTDLEDGKTVGKLVMKVEASRITQSL